MRNEGYRIESNHQVGKRLSRITTQATQVLLYENIFCNEAALLNGNPRRIPLPLINSDRVRRYLALSSGPGQLKMRLIRRAHIQFVSNLKLRVVAPSSSIDTEPECEEDEDEVVYGDGTSGFLSSTY